MKSLIEVEFNLTPYQIIKGIMEETICPVTCIPYQRNDYITGKNNKKVNQPLITLGQKIVASQRRNRR